MRNYSHTWQTNWVKKMSRFRMVIAFLVVFGGIGTALLFDSHATTPTASIEAEAGSAATSAATVTDSTASASQAVTFNSATTGGGGTGTYPSNYPQNCGVDGEVASDAFKDQAIAGYPTVCTTGWIHTGVALTTQSGDMTASTAGMTIDSKLITGDIVVKAANVHITRSWVQGRIQVVSGNAIVSDTEMGPPNHNIRVPGDVGHGGIGPDNYTCARCYIHGHSDLTWINGNVDIEDSLAINPFILVAPAVPEAQADHADGGQNSGGSGNVTVNHSYFDIRAVNVNDEGGAGFIWGDGGSGNATFSNNIIAGGSWAMSLHENGHFTITNNKFIDNSSSFGIFYLTNGIVTSCTGNTSITPAGAFVSNESC